MIPSALLLGLRLLLIVHLPVDLLPYLIDLELEILGDYGVQQLLWLNPFLEYR